MAYAEPHVSTRTCYSPITTLCRFKCAVTDVCIIPSAVLQVYDMKSIWSRYEVAVGGINIWTVSAACGRTAVATLLESGNTRERLIAAGADVHHVLAVRDAERNETATQQHAPAIKHARASQSSRTQYHDTRAVFKGGLRVQPPRKIEKKIFWQCKKARPAKCERWRTLCLHYCDAR